MAEGISLSMTAEWKEGPEAEYAAVMEEIKSAFRLGLAVVRGTAKDKLIERIWEDVYNAFGEPKDYHRRYGKGLLDMENSLYFNHDEAANDSAFYVEDTMLYHPHGDSPQWDDPAYGDKMIDRIENDKGYEWEIDVGPRPYWTNFVDRMLNYSTGFADAGQRVADVLSAEGMEVVYAGLTEVRDERGDGDYTRY